MGALFSDERIKYHKRLLEEGVLTIDNNGVPSNADKSSVLSKAIASGIANRLTANTQEKTVGQTTGARFEQVNMEFLESTFPQLQHLRPGTWHITKLGNRNAIKTSNFAQYQHLDYLNRLMSYDSVLASSMGNDYMVAPDVVIYRDPIPDEEINRPSFFVDDSICTMADLRSKNSGLPILHASISAKWTMRSDRAQNSRTEALNLIRNRKGSLPHIVVVTGEPMPARISSLAMGTGDIDCVYHFALYELIESVMEIGSEDAIETLKMLTDGKRLKDISDLPLDLAV